MGSGFRKILIPFGVAASSANQRARICWTYVHFGNELPLFCTTLVA